MNRIHITKHPDGTMTADRRCGDCEDLLIVDDISIRHEEAFTGGVYPDFAPITSFSTGVVMVVLYAHCSCRKHVISTHKEYLTISEVEV